MDAPTQTAVTTSPTPTATMAASIAKDATATISSEGADGPAKLAQWKAYIYREELPGEELAPTRKVLAEYSGIAADEVDAHIRRIVRHP